MSWSAMSKRDRFFLIGAILILVLTALNMRDWVAGLVVFAFWFVLWIAWRDKDKGGKLNKAFNKIEISSDE